MLCQNCKVNEANTHIKRVVNGEATQKHLCSSCAQSLGYDNFFSDFTFNLPSLFSSFFDDRNLLLGETKADRCEICGCSFEDIIKSGNVGCSNCYKKFYSKLQPSIQRIHGKVRHSGKVPVKAAEPIVVKEKTAQEKISDLEKEMAKAIETQNFERAAAIRDEIKSLKGEN